jgi:hypothetical protein
MCLPKKDHIEYKKFMDSNYITSKIIYYCNFIANNSKSEMFLCNYRHYIVMIVPKAMA